MEDDYDDFEDIRADLTERQIRLLRHYDQPQHYPYSGDFDAADRDALLKWNLIETGEGRSHKESFTGNRVVSTHGARPEATDKGRAWLEWYDGE